MVILSVYKWPYWVSYNVQTWPKRYTLALFLVHDQYNVFALIFTLGELTKLERSVIGALITIDVHARDMITDMVRVQVDDASSFDWQKQLRYYWDLNLDNCVVRMSNSNYIYGYEYLGSSPRLVITPLTVSTID